MCCCLDSLFRQMVCQPKGYELGSATSLYMWDIASAVIWLQKVLRQDADRIVIRRSIYFALCWLALATGYFGAAGADGWLEGFVAAAAGAHFVGSLFCFDGCCVLIDFQVSYDEELSCEVTVV